MITQIKKEVKCKTYIILFAIVLSVIFSMSTKAVNPGTIEGSVTDVDTYKGVSFANVELLKSMDSSLVKATITNNEGLYKLEDIAYGKYLIRISCLGYRKQMIPEFEITPQQPVIKFGITNIFTESKKLDEISIIGQKLTGRIEDEKTVYTIPSKSADIAQSGTELLRQLPDVTVSYMSNEVKMAGSSNILYQVNGKRVDVNYLNQLNPKLVDKIEVITNPGVKYDSDVDAIINVLLKKDMKYGLSGRVRLEIPNGETVLSRSNASFDLFFKKLRIYGGGFFRVNQFDIEIFEDRTNYLLEDTSHLSRVTKGLSKDLRAGYNYGIDWFWNDNNTLNFYSSGRPGIANDNDFITDITYKSDTGRYNSRGSTTNIDDNGFYDYSLFYKHKFPKKNHDISLESYFSMRTSDNSTIYNEQQVLDGNLSDSYLLQQDRKRITDNNQWIFKVDYNYPFTEKLKLSAGYNGNYTWAQYLITEKYSDLNDTTDYTEARQIAYSNLAWNVGNLNLQAGIRYEFSDIDITHGMDITNRYDCWLPSVSGQYKLGKKHNFRLNYRKSVTRPSVNQLSPTRYSDDNYSQSEGNQNLGPAYNNRFEFTHRYQIAGPMYVSYRPYINFIKNGIQNITLPTTDSVQRKKYDNVSNDLEYGVTLSGTLAPGKWASISPSFTYYRREMEALPEYGIADAQRYTSWRFNVSSQFILPKEWVIFVEYNLSSPYKSLQGWNKQNYEFVTGFYKAINKKFNVTIFTLNPWSHRYIYNKSHEVSTGFYRDSDEGVNYDYVFFIRLGYSFNIGKEGKKLDRQRESEENGDKGKLF
jgi:hypothetical protein